jgi:hypothetical protein
MTNKIIIDGWNVCWKIPEIAELIPNHLERARNRLNTLIKIFFQGKKVEYKIFYDGQPLFFSGAIQHRELTYRVKNNNALILTSEAFVSKLISNRSPKFKVNTKENPRIDQEDISYWLNKFKNNTNR